MAKKKKSIELSGKNIIFSIEKQSYKAIRFYPSQMTLDVMLFTQNKEKVGMHNIPFAHIPKEIKKLIKPN